jgi:hypothetical protein
MFMKVEHNLDARPIGEDVRPDGVT